VNHLAFLLDRDLALTGGVENELLVAQSELLRVVRADLLRVRARHLASQACVLFLGHLYQS